MLVELVETSSSTWTWEDTSGLHWSTVLSANDRPVEVKVSSNNIKKLIKLKEAGFTADEIIEMSKEDVL